MSIEVIGHQGARFEAPENTLEGFRHALALGLTTVEFDVQAAVITSFDPYALELAQKHAPEIRRGLIGDFSNPVM